MKTKILLTVAIFFILSSVIFASDVASDTKKLEIFTKKSQIPTWTIKEIIFKGIIYGEYDHLVRINVFLREYRTLKGITGLPSVPERTEGKKFPATLIYEIQGNSHLILEIEEKIDRYINSQSPYLQRVSPDDIEIRSQ